MISRSLKSNVLFLDKSDCRLKSRAKLLILFISFKLVDSKAVIAGVSASSKLNINQARASEASASAVIVLMK